MTTSGSVPPTTALSTIATRLDEGVYAVVYHSGRAALTIHIESDADLCAYFVGGCTCYPTSVPNVGTLVQGAPTCPIHRGPDAKQWDWLPPRTRLSHTPDNTAFGLVAHRIKVECWPEQARASATWPGRDTPLALIAKSPAQCLRLLTEQLRARGLTLNPRPPEFVVPRLRGPVIVPVTVTHFAGGQWVAQAEVNSEVVVIVAEQRAAALEGLRAQFSWRNAGAGEIADVDRSSETRPENL